jgi:hypothetical protein
MCSFGAPHAAAHTHGWPVSKRDMRPAPAPRKQCMFTNSTADPGDCGTPALVQWEAVRDADAHACRTNRKGAEPRKVLRGRPDIPGAIRTQYESRGKGESLCVWSAGPRAVNQAVLIAANKLPFWADVRIMPMAYDL